MASMWDPLVAGLLAVSPVPVLRGHHDPALTARVVRARPLTVRGGPSPLLDLPGHVRAGSGLTYLGGRLVVVQDDTLALALVDPAAAAVRLLPLPPGPDGVRSFSEARGTKRLKPDLEACAVDGERLLAFGSGSTAARERVLVADGLAGAGRRPTPRLVPLPALYAALRAEPGFAGSELNLEGAALVGEALYLFNRGNGAPRGDLVPTDAVARLDLGCFRAHLEDPAHTPVPTIEVLGRYLLGGLGGVRLTFTDAAPGPRGTLLFLAGAEDSPDTYRDGPVTGAALGILAPGEPARWAPLLDATGAPFLEKAEGLTLDPEHPGRAWIVTDTDDPERPASLCEIEFEGY